MEKIGQAQVVTLKPRCQDQVELYAEPQLGLSNRWNPQPVNQEPSEQHWSVLP